MRWTMKLIGTASTIAVIAAAVTVYGGGSAAQGAGDTTITLFQDGHGGTSQFIDNRPRSPIANPDSPRARFSMGDQLYFTSKVLDHQGGRRIGRLFGAESVLSGTRFPHIKNIVHAVFKLTDGQIVVDGVVNEADQRNVQASVVGGTGSYEGARGTFSITPGRGGNQISISLVP